MPNNAFKRRRAKRARLNADVGHQDDQNFAFACTLLAVIAMVDDVSQLQPTPEMVREAKRNPGGWVYAISGKFGPNDAVPPQAIAGAWKVDEKGNIIPGSFKPNPNYTKT